MATARARHWSTIPLVLGLLISPCLAEAKIDVELAKKYYKLGAELYKRGDYKAALYQFEESYRHSKRPALLFNMGRCREGMGQPELAMAHYNEYLKTNPANADEVRGNVARLQKALKHKEKSPEPASITNSPGAPRSTRRIAGWALVGAGAAGLVAGGVLGGMAMSKQSALEDAYKNREMTYPEFQDGIESGEGLELGAIISLAVGGAAAAAGATLLILDHLSGDGEERMAWIAPGFSADGATISAGLHF